MVGSTCIVGLAGCSDDTSSSAPPSTETVGSPVSSAVPSTATSAPASTSPASTVASTSPVTEAGAVTEIEIVPSVDWLEVDEHGVWARLEPALVYRVDPETNEVGDEVRVGGVPCQGLGVGDGSVWTCAGPDVVRIDPSTSEVVAVFPVGKTYGQGELAVFSGTMWILTGDGSSLLPIDTETNTPGVPIALPARGTDLGAGRSGVWVVSSVDDVVMHVDPATGAVLSTTGLAGPTDVAVDDEVWVVAAAETVRIDVSSGAVDLTVPVGGRRDGGIALSADTVWIRSTETFVTRIERATGVVIDDQYTAVYAEIAGRLTSGGDIVAGFGSIWTSASDDARLFRIATGE